MNTITIDCGASFLKGAIIDNDGQILKQVDRKSPVVHLNEPITEPVQITSLMNEVRQLIKLLMANDSNNNEVKLCISNEMHGFIIADENGTPIIDYISWQKEYGGRKLLEDNIFKDEIIKTGMGVRDGLPSCNLFYLIKSNIIANIKKMYFLTLGDYILFALSGHVPNCHPTNAAATGLYDVTRGGWNLKLISLIGADFICFPQIGDLIFPFELGGKTVYAFPAIGDQQAALLGAGLEREDELSFNLGTGAQVSKLISGVEFSKKNQIRPYFYGKYLKTIPHLPSGRAINVYFRFVKDLLEKFGVNPSDEEIWKVILKNLRDVPDTAIKCDISFFENAVTNHDKGSITDISEYEFTIDNLMRAVICTMANNFIWAADTICDDRNNISTIIFSGGIARKNSYLRERLINEYPNAIEVKVADNETLYGLYKYSNFRR